jgi:hypothetical protein
MSNRSQRGGEVIMSLYNNKQTALLELMELLSKGIDLLANNTLDKDLYNAFERYVQSTIKLIDSAYMTTYESNFFPAVNPFQSHSSNVFGGYMSSSSYPTNTMAPNCDDYSANPFLNVGISSNRDYKPDLKILLQRLISIVKALFYNV